MTTLERTFVTVAQAKQLKKLGFDEPCIASKVPGCNLYIHADERLDDPSNIMSLTQKIDEFTYSEIKEEWNSNGRLSVFDNVLLYPTIDQARSFLLNRLAGIYYITVFNDGSGEAIKEFNGCGSFKSSHQMIGVLLQLVVEQERLHKLKNNSAQL